MLSLTVMSSHFLQLNMRFAVAVRTFDIALCKRKRLFFLLCTKRCLTNIFIAAVVHTCFLVVWLLFISLRKFITVKSRQKTLSPTCLPVCSVDIRGLPLTSTPRERIYQKWECDQEFLLPHVSTQLMKVPGQVHHNQ